MPAPPNAEDTAMHHSENFTEEIQTTNANEQVQTDGIRGLV